MNTDKKKEVAEALRMFGIRPVSLGVEEIVRRELEKCGFRYEQENDRYVRTSKWIEGEG